MAGADWSGGGLAQAHGVGLGFAPAVALSVFGADFLEDVGGGLSLYPFGYDLLVQGVGYRDQGLDHGAVAGVVGEVLDEGSIDLDEGDGECAEVAEAGEGDAEVVEGELAAQVDEA